MALDARIVRPRSVDRRAGGCQARIFGGQTSAGNAGCGRLAGRRNDDPGVGKGVARVGAKVGAKVWFLQTRRAKGGRTLRSYRLERERETG